MKEERSIDNKIVKEFKDKDIATEFILKKYSDVVKKIDSTDLKYMGSIQARARYNDSDKECMEAFEKCFAREDFPVIDEEIVIYRAGEMQPDNRDYLSASLFKKIVVDNYCKDINDLNIIILEKGTKVFPLRAIDKDYGDCEGEIIIRTKNIKKIADNYYISI